MKIKVNSRMVDETTHYARLDQEQLHAIITDAVAKAAGVNLAARGVEVRRCFISSQDTSTGPTKYAEVQIVVDHRPQDAAAT